MGKEHSVVKLCPCVSGCISDLGGVDQTSIRGVIRQREEAREQKSPARGLVTPYNIEKWVLGGCDDPGRKFVLRQCGWSQMLDRKSNGAVKESHRH